MNYSHLGALELNLSDARIRLAACKNVKQIELFKVFVAQLEREVAGERKFLGMEIKFNVSDDDLLNELDA